MNYSEQERELARRGYCYMANSNAGNGMRKRVRVITNEKRADLIFDWAAFEAHN